VTAQCLGARSSRLPTSSEQSKRELGGIMTFDRLPRAAMRLPIFTGDPTVQTPSQTTGVEPLGESLALAALIANTHLGGEVAIHPAGNWSVEGDSNSSGLAGRLAHGACAGRPRVLTRPVEERLRQCS
jgi:hypothetical protein